MFYYEYHMVTAGVYKFLKSEHLNQITTGKDLAKLHVHTLHAKSASCTYDLLFHCWFV